MQRIRLKIKWNRAKTDSSGKIIGWDDYTPGDVIEIDEKDISFLSLSDDAYDIIVQEKTKKSSSSNRIQGERIQKEKK